MKNFEVGDFITIKNAEENFHGVYLIAEELTGDFKQEHQYFLITDTETVTDFAVPDYFIEGFASIFTEGKNNE